MPVVFSKDFHKDLDVDGSIKAKAWDFVRKLSIDPDITGLDFKMPKGAIDKRVRTARVDDGVRAVLFDMSRDGESFYLLAAIKQHDEAYALAETLELRVNPVNGIAEVLRHQDVERVVRDSLPEPTVDDRPYLVPFTVDELTGLGVLADAARAAARVRDEDELQELCLALPEWQADVLLQLACGVGIEEVRAAYEPAPAADIGEALKHPASRMQFVVVTGEDDEELRAMIEGDFGRWRTFLHPDQRAVAYRDKWNGSFRLSGGAGTGKTVVAIHRASYLARSTTRPTVLLTTFTRTLAGHLEADLVRLAGPGIVARSGSAAPGAVTVAGVDSVARSIVSKVDGQVPKIMSEPEENRLWEDAAQDLPEITPAELDLLTPAFLRAEYRNVILAQEITDRQRYLKAPRKGRGVRLNWLQRGRVWDVVETFRRRLDGRATFLDLAARAASLLADPVARAKVDTFDSVIVDEGQDLHATHWLMLRRLVAEGPNDLFICEDGHQRVYGEKLTLGQFGIHIVGRSRRLTLNYRTTRQNLRFALGLIDGEVSDLDGAAETVAGYRSLLSGAEPTARGFANEAMETAAIVETVQGWRADLDAALRARHGADVDKAGMTPDLSVIGVLARTNRQCDDLARALRQAGIPVETLGKDSDVTGDGVRVATMHRAKGTEFARVIVARLSDVSVPEHWILEQSPEGDHADILQRERLLLYVAATRARDHLMLTWSGAPSRFLPAVSARKA